MTVKNQVYKCAICGNMTEVLHVGIGELVCCGKPMNLLKENTEDASTEKHIPVIETADCGVMVKVGSLPHPMTAEHYIEWIEVITADKVYRQDLKVGNAPEAKFCLDKKDILQVRAYCNLHGLWKS